MFYLNPLCITRKLHQQDLQVEGTVEGVYLRNCVFFGIITTFWYHYIFGKKRKGQAYDIDWLRHQKFCTVALEQRQH